VTQPSKEATRQPLERTDDRDAMTMLFATLMLVVGVI
jgi:hypothetical protein